MNRLVLRLSLGLAATSLSLVALAQNINGAIWTTNGTGGTVDQNIYALKEDVYLNGGPNNVKASGLDPDFDYYFQVTDPSGKELLSSDSIDHRMVHVDSTGRIVSAVDHPTSPDTSAGNTGSNVVVQLAPYDDTPNPGGEYKVWLTKVGDYDATKGVHGFLPSRSKTDNFRIGTNDLKIDSAISFLKFYDANGNGVMDPTDVPIPGFMITVTYTPPNMDTPVTTDYLTDADGLVTVLTKPETPYTASETLPTISAYVWHESFPNALGGDVVLINNLYGYSGTTPPQGQDWLDPKAFGNFATSFATGGLTLGFWSNKNGQMVLDGTTSANNNNWRGVLTALNLRNGAGANFDPPASYSTFRSWLLNATATNMAYMLSVQFAATRLDALFGYIDPLGSYYIPDTAKTPGGANINTVLAANGLGSAVIGGRIYTLAELFTAANTTLGANGYTVASGPVRTYQEALKTVFDGINNNGGGVIPGLGGGIVPPIPDFSY